MTTEYGSTSSSSGSSLDDEILPSSSDFTTSSESYFESDRSDDSDMSTSHLYLKSLNTWDDVESDIEYTPNDLLQLEEDDYEAFVCYQSESKRKKSPPPKPMSFSWQVQKTRSPELQFRGKQKLKLNPGDTPFDYFNLIADEEFLNTIIRATNRNAARVVSELQSSNRTFVWKDLDIPEFKTFLGLLYLSGPNLEDNWRPSKYFLNHLFPKSMSRDRFLFIMKALSFTERNAKRNPEFKAQEIKYFIELIAYQMSKVYSPGRELCVGCHRAFNMWAQDGITMCVLADPTGAVLNVHVCFGCEKNESQIHSDEMVLNILRPYFNIGHSVFVSKKYGSVRLARLLASKKFHYTGRVSPNRDSDITEWLKNRLDDEGCEALYTEGGLSCIKWKEKKDEFWLSTEFDHKPTLDTTRLLCDDHYLPESILRYYENMAAGGNFERFIARDIEDSYYRQMIVKLFSLLLFNASSLYNKFSNNRQIEPNHFREVIIKNLLETGMGVGSRIKEQSHFPFQVSIQAQCKYCYSNGWTKAVGFICPACPSQTFLCLKCFEPYHANYV